MKKLLALIFACSAAVSLAACTDDSTTTDPESGDVGDNGSGDNESGDTSTTVVLTYSTDSYVSTTTTSYTVVDGADLALEVPTHVGANCTFAGWYTGENGTGIQVADAAGTSSTGYAGTSATVYAHWDYNLEFTLLTDGSNAYNAAGTIASAVYGTIFVPATYNGANVTSVNGFTTIYPDDDSGSVRQQMTKIYIPATVTYINDANFSNCPNLEEIIVDAANTTYESFNGALYGDNGATLIRIPKMMSVDNFTFPSYTTAIADGAFKSTALTSITLPEGLTSIGKETFAYTSLTTITIPASVTYIGQQAFAATFAGASTLREVIFAGGSTLETIDERAFSNQQISVINLPASVKTVVADSFEQNTALTTLTINGTTTIQGYAFYGCSAVDLIINGAATLQSNAFGTINSVTFNNQTALDNITSGGLINNCTNIILGAGITAADGSYVDGVLNPTVEEEDLEV